MIVVVTFMFSGRVRVSIPAFDLGTVPPIFKSLIAVHSFFLLFLLAAIFA